MDTELLEILQQEQQRQREGLELIPSENYVSRAVLDALGSEFTNKYSEGYPGRRYYGGQENTDKIEQIAIDSAKELFGSDHANVQPLSGAPANMEVYAAWCKPGDTILGMELSHGGHLTHGHPVTFSAQVYNFVRYGIKDLETGEIDYEEMRDLALKHKPKIVLAGFSAFPRELDYEKIVAIAEEVDAVAMMDMAHIAGLVAGGALANPVKAGFHVVTSTTHKSLRGPRGGLILSNGTVGNPLQKPEHTRENLPTLIDRMVFPGMQGGPHMNNVMAKAVAFQEALQPEFKTYAQAIIGNAKRLADELMKRDFKLVTNGTDNHLVLANVQESFGINGKVAEEALDSIGLTLNKNAVPDDPNPPFSPSGIRLGTPAITTRGLGEDDMQLIADWMKQALDNHNKSSKLEAIHKEVKEFCLRFPLPSDN